MGILLAVVQALLVLGWLPLAQAAIVCDGVDDYALSAVNLVDFKPTASTGTWMAWLTPTGVTGVPGGTCIHSSVQKVIGAGAGSGTQRITLGRREDTDSCMSHYDGGTDQLLGAFAGADAPVHLAAVHGAGVIEFYVNGLSISTNPSGDTNYTASPIWICNNNSGSQATLAGTVHHVLFSEHTFTAGEIANLALGKRPRVRHTAATGEWFFDNCADGASGEAVAFQDVSGNTRPLTAGDGANNTGMTCRGSSVLSYGGYVQ